MLIERQRKAVEHKQRTLAMYDNMARSAPAGGKKTMDIGILQTGQSKTQLMSILFINLIIKSLCTVTPPSTPSVRDNDSQDVLLQCKQAAEDRKKKILAAYEAAARSAPAGATKSVDMQEFIKADGKGDLLVNQVFFINCFKPFLILPSVQSRTTNRWSRPRARPPSKCAVEFPKCQRVSCVVVQTTHFENLTQFPRQDRHRELQ